MNSLPPVIQDIKDDFNQAVLNQNVKTNPTVKGADWDVYGTSIAVIASMIRQDIQSAINSTFTQYQRGLALDWEAYSIGQLPRRAETFATVSATGSSSISLTLPSNTEFTTTYNGAKYLTINPITLTSSLQDISLRSDQSGTGFSLPFGSTLKSKKYPDITLTVKNSTEGEDTETDNQLKKRLLYVQQHPTGGDRNGQYYAWALESDPDVTDAIIEPELYPDRLIIGIFVLAGGESYDYLLTHNIPYNRKATKDTIYNSAVKLNALISFASAIQVASLALYVPVNFGQSWLVQVSVNLLPGAELTDLITNIDGSLITIHDMIFQELRRAFITYDFGGEEIRNNQYLITTTRLTAALWNSLSIRDGIYGKILTDVTILINGDAVNNITVPHNVLDIDGNLVALYDLITYDGNQNVVTVPGYTIQIYKQAYVNV